MKTPSEQQHAPTAQKHISNGGCASFDLMATPLMQRRQQQQARVARPKQQRVNRTGLPYHLKSGMENLYGYDLDEVRVHYNSTKPAAVQAEAYAQGYDIHLASGQEKHLPHELGHVVQQMRGQVQANNSVKGMALNDNVGLEVEASWMGNMALQQYSKVNDEGNNETQTHTPLISNAHYTPNKITSAALYTSPIQRHLAIVTGTEPTEDEFENAKRETVHYLLHLLKTASSVYVYKNWKDALAGSIIPTRTTNVAVANQCKWLYKKTDHLMTLLRTLIRNHDTHTMKYLGTENDLQIEYDAMDVTLPFIELSPSSDNILGPVNKDGALGPNTNKNNSVEKFEFEPLNYDAMSNEKPVAAKQISLLTLNSPFKSMDLPEQDPPSLTLFRFLFSVSKLSLILKVSEEKYMKQLYAASKHNSNTQYPLGGDLLHQKYRGEEWYANQELYKFEVSEKQIFYSATSPLVINDQSPDNALAQEMESSREENAQADVSTQTEPVDLGGGIMEMTELEAAQFINQQQHDDEQDQADDVMGREVMKQDGDSDNKTATIPNQYVGIMGNKLKLTLEAAIKKARAEVDIHEKHITNLTEEEAEKLETGLSVEEDPKGITAWQKMKNARMWLCDTYDAGRDKAGWCVSKMLNKCLISQELPYVVWKDYGATTVETEGEAPPQGTFKQPTAETERGILPGAVEDEEKDGNIPGSAQFEILDTTTAPLKDKIAEQTDDQMLGVIEHDADDSTTKIARLNELNEELFTSFVNKMKGEDATKRKQYRDLPLTLGAEVLALTIDAVWQAIKGLIETAEGGAVSTALKGMAGIEVFAGIGAIICNRSSNAVDLLRWAMGAVNCAISIAMVSDLLKDQLDEQGEITTESAGLKQYRDGLLLAWSIISVLNFLLGVWVMIRRFKTATAELCADISGRLEELYKRREKQLKIKEYTSDLAASLERYKQKTIKLMAKYGEVPK